MMHADLIDQDDFRERLQALGFSVPPDSTPEQACEYAVRGLSPERAQALRRLVEDMLGGHATLLPAVREAISRQLLPALGCCYWRDGRARTDALLDLGLLEAPLLRTAMLVYLCVPGAFMGANLVAMLYLQRPLGLSASRAGALMLPWALAAGLAIGLTRRRFNRWGPKSLLLAGMAIQAGGLLWLARSGEGSGFWQLAGAYATMGFGGSLCSSAAQGMALLDVPAARMGHASALWNINRQLAFCLGMAVLGGLLNLLQARADPAAFVHCFLFAAAFTLLPLPWVRRIDSAGVRALVQT